jgi:rhamnogalacturonyl hydrolase YesR
MSARLVFISLLAWLSVVAQAQSETAPSIPARNDIAAVMRRACDWQLGSLATEQVGKDDTNRGWIRAPFFVGTLALYRETNDARYLDPILKIAEENHFQPGKRFRHADDEAVGQVYTELYFLKHDPAMIAPLRDRWDKIMAQPMAGRVDWWWCDSLFMAPPTLARLGAATGDTKYFDFLDKQWWDTTDYLFDKSENLFFRDKSYFQTREANGKKIFWSRGNGWVLAGTARVLQYLPRDYPTRAKYVNLFTKMSDRIAGLQQPDGFWRTSLLDPDSCPGGESSGTGFYCYAMAWGINEGILPRQRYLPVVVNAWKALSGAVDASGKLQWVQKPGAKPARIEQGDTVEYGVGALLLAGSEMCKLSGDAK